MKLTDTGLLLILSNCLKTTYKDPGNGKQGMRRDEQALDEFLHRSMTF